MLGERAWAIAAKFENGRYHPLICHMLDVAAVVEAMWDTRLSDRERQSLAGGFGLPADEARRWTAFLAGLHDLGKCTASFQRFRGKDAGFANRLGELLPRQPVPDDPGHGIVTTTVLADLLEGLGLPVRMSRSLATVAGGHHGRFLLRKDGLASLIGEKSPSDGERWAALRREVFVEFERTLEVHDLPRAATLPNPAAMLLAGIISVCDWIGSDVSYFPYFTHDADRDLDTYLRESRSRAGEALASIHWTSVAPDGSRPGMKDLFGEKRTPRPLQKIAEEFDPSSQPGLVIIEAPTGEGKTEAALLFADRWNAGGFTGQYVALPTQATANQMYGRVRDYLERRYPGQGVTEMLAHGGAWMNEGVAVLPSGVAGDDASSTVAAAEWFLGRKRTLLAPYGVGTIDQALFAVLQVKRVFVRLFGVAGKVIVLDEVHAYDTYMTGLIERLLNWLGALGSPVVLLSATLPSSRRQHLVDAYNAGLRGSIQPPLEIPQAPYPRITSLMDGVAAAVHVAPSDRSIRKLAIERIRDDGGHAQIAELLERELQDGGCAAVICNTVSRAQEMYRSLRDQFSGEVSLFHARFVSQDRERIEKECLQRFGPNGRDGDRRRQVLVATQVVEQSLDLDFDVMVTDLAPIDLLVQRAGRLQRHERGPRKSPLALHIVWPEMKEGIPHFDPGTAAVYDPHVLLRTWWELYECAVIDVPGDVQDLVDAVYDAPEAPPEGMEAGLADYWTDSWSELSKKKTSEEDEARARRLKPPWNGGALTEFTRDPKDEDAPDLHPALQALTRLAGPSVGLVVLEPGDPALASKEKPASAEIRRLLGRAVTVTQQGLVRALLETNAPRAWADVPTLRGYRVVEIGYDQAGSLAGYSIAYNESIGLMAVRGVAT